MKKYKIRYQHGDNYFSKIIEAESKTEAIAKFYVAVDCYDIIEVQEVK